MYEDRAKDVRAVLGQDREALVDPVIEILYRYRLTSVLIAALLVAILKRERIVRRLSVLLTYLRRARHWRCCPDFMSSYQYE